MKDFAATLRKLREKAGHPSARAFYRARGGQRFFGCTYKAYLNIEAGRSLPQPALSLRIGAGLDVSGDAARAKEYVSAYLRSAVGEPELADFLLRVLGAKPAAASMFHKASEVGYQEKTLPLTREQSELLTSSAERYWAFAILSDDVGRWRPAELAKFVRLPEPRVRAALDALVKAGLLASKDGGYWCPDAGKVFRYPRDKFYVPDYMPALSRFWGEMADRQGGVLLDRHFLLRASESDLRGYFPYLAQAVNGAHVYSVTDKAADTSLVAVEVRVRRLAPF